MATKTLFKVGGRFGLPSYEIRSNNGTLQVYKNGTLTTLTDNSGGTPGSSVASTIATYTAIIPVQLPALADGQQWKLTIPHAYTIVLQPKFRVGRPVTTAAKSSTLQVQINGVSVTGGAVTLTSGGMTPTGNTQTFSGVTAGGSGTANQTLGFVVSGTTAFAEGDGYVEFLIRNDDMASAIASILAVL